jgi:KUP system potassium uptake protein
VTAPDTQKTGLVALTLGALGVVFGDIGTSPLYTFKECLHGTGGRASAADIYGVLSLIFWALTLVVTVKYLAFIMRADNHGEGGIFALLALVPEELRTARPGRIATIAVFGLIGAALLYGDGVITPAISVLSAVEGLGVADPRWASAAVPASCAILLGLFWIQKRGTGAVGRLFGPVMVVWFVTLAAIGGYHVAQSPAILAAVSPVHAWDYFARHGWQGLHILSSVILAVTGGEALYADMGHFGVKPIRRAWLWLVFPALALSYFGQGAHALRNPGSAANPFFDMVPAGAATVALVILSSMAAVIASQALISGAFSLTRQAMQLGFFPRMRVTHTAHHTEGQIYIPEINSLLGIGAIALVLVFGESSRLAAAYGIAVAGTMAITSVMYFLVVRQAWGWTVVKAAAVLLVFLSFDLPFLGANLAKFVHGGYVPVMLGAIVLTVMIVWNRGRTLLAHRARTRFRSWEEAHGRVQEKLAARVPGTAVFMASSRTVFPVQLVRHVERSRSLHRNVILATVRTTGSPVVPGDRRYTIEQLPDGYWRFVAEFGFMEGPRVVPVIEEAARAAGIPYDPAEVTYYIGRDSFLASSRGSMGAVTESIFSFLVRNSVPADRFFGLPPRQVVELGTQVDL